MFAEDWARAPYFLQTLDARVKLVGLLLLLVTVSLVHHVFTLGLMAAAALGMALASGLGLSGLRHPLWWAGPVFAVFIALPAAFSAITSGVPFIVILKHPFLSITYPGLEVAGRLVLRVTASVWWTGALLLSTRWERLLAVLRTLGIPSLFIFSLAMAHRYLFLFVRLSEKAFYARRSRSLLPVTAGTERAVIGGRIAGLFRHSTALAHQVHAAMLSRGFAGEYRSLEGFRLRAHDILWAAAAASFCLAIWLFDLSLRYGNDARGV
jgi:energy-coupling factor transporter transmembrane protein EcfT